MSDRGERWESEAEELVAAVLQATAQPIWVVDPDGLIRFANPAAVAVLGYDGANELLGRHGHETIHYRRPDGSVYPASECPMLLPRTTGETVSSQLDWFFRRDGSMFPVSYVSVPIELPEGRGAVVAFSDIEERRRAEQDLREREARLTEQQAALRRVAALVAVDAASSDVFAAVAREVGQLLQTPLVQMSRYELDGTATVIGAWSERPHPIQAGTRWALQGPTISMQVRETGQPARLDNLDDVAGALAEAVRRTGIRSVAGAPIVVNGRVWGVMATGSTEGQRLPADIEHRLAEFTELVATAIANTDAREDLQRLADEQAALRRIATLVAQGAESQLVFDAVCEETGRLFAATTVNLVHFTPDGFHLAMSGWSVRGVHVPTGTLLPLTGETIDTIVRRTAAPGRCDSYEGVSGELAELIRRQGIRSEVGAPVIVGGNVWGALIAGTDESEPLTAGTEDRLASFAELIATAVSNATARSELLASRARIVAAADEQRRRVVRDLHDGAQQRLVNALITLQLAQGLGDAPPELARLVNDALEHTGAAIEELRELAHGIHPALLTSRGLAAAIEALADRASVPVRVDASDRRYPAVVESAAYFVAAEALTNVSKYANATAARITVAEGAESLLLTIEDDGIGGASLAAGRGLSGLLDRVAALDGTLTVDSPPGEGTRIRAEIPLPPGGSREPLGAAGAARSS